MAEIDHFTNIVTRADRVARNRTQSMEGSWSRQSWKTWRMLVAGCSSTLRHGVWRLGPGKRAFVARLCKFLVVGGTGVLVNSLALLVLYHQVHLPLVVASTLSVELAILNNFCWNDRWTFERRNYSLSRFAQFNLVSLGGLAITTFTLWVLVCHLNVYYLAANLLGIGLATAWNFAANLFWTWRSAQ